MSPSAGDSASAPALGIRFMLRRSPIVFALLACLLTPTLARADGGSKLLIDACRDEKVDGKYSQKDYSKALSELSTDADQYSACRSVIERARLAALGGTKGGGGGTGGATGGGGAGTGDTGTGSTGAADPLASATPEQRKAVADASKAGAKAVQLGGATVTPGALGLGHLAKDGHSIPVPLIVLLAALALAALGGGGRLLWTRVLAGRLG